MKHLASLPLLLVVMLITSCSKNTGLEDYEKYDVNTTTSPPNSPSFRPSSGQHTASVEVCPYLCLGTNDTISYKDNLKVCIKDIILYLRTDGKETTHQLQMDARYGDREGLVFWEDIPEGIGHNPEAILADSFHCSYSWACEAVAEITYKIRMRDNDLSTGWSEWESKQESKISLPDFYSQIMSIIVPINMNAITFNASVDEDKIP